MDLAEAVEQHLTSMHDAFSARSTIEGRRYLLRPFVAWCLTQDIGTCALLNPEVIRRHQHHLAERGNLLAGGLSLHARRNRLAALKAFAQWALKRSLISADPTSDITLPRLPRRLPQGVLSRAEADRVLRRPDITTALGLRDRAMLELLYCSGLRRNELIALDLTDIDHDRHLIFVRLGKGRKDRVVPVGPRARRWLTRYVSEVRGTLLNGRPSLALFVGKRGTRITRARINERLRAYIVSAKIGKRGSCHIWRHTVATAMHERGADIRDLQVLLGHSQLSTTSLYTHVSVLRLVTVHRRTHPAWHDPESPENTRRPAFPRSASINIIDMARAGIEPATRGFSVRCSTN